MATRTKAIPLEVEDLESRRLLAVDALEPPLPAAPPSWTTSAAGGLEQEVTGVTDPRIIKEGNSYYLFSTGTGIPIHTSADLVHWSAAGRVFGAIPPWAQAQVPGATSIWAPDTSYYDGQYHLYYAVSTFGSKRSVIGLATSTTLDPSAPDYGWVDQGEVLASSPRRTDYNAIDPAVAIDDRARVWLAFGSQWSGIKLARLDPATGKPQGRHPRLIALASRPRSKPIEAAFVFERDGFYYLFVSFDVCCMGAGSTYKIMVGRSRSITGPYVDRHGRPMTEGGGTLVLGSNTRFHGPGHNSVLAAGDSDDLVYHTYDAQNGGIPTLQIRPLSWTTDGWPVVGAPLF
jgi:arabinan endo-1,5-alpha-L-arabinosidase